MALVLLVSGTYGWFLFDGEMQTGDHIDLDYSNGVNRLDIESHEYYMEVWFLDEATGEYVLQDSDQPMVFTGIVPNGVVRFKVRFKNYSAVPVTGNLSLRGVQFTANNENDPIDNPLDMFFVSVSAGFGYTNREQLDVRIPSNQFIRFSDVAGPTQTLLLYRSLPIPVNDKLQQGTTEDDYAELNCYIWLDSRADNRFQGVKLTVEKIVFVI